MAALAVLATACVPPSFYVDSQQPDQVVVQAAPQGGGETTVVAGTGQGMQYLYVPTTNIPVSLIEQVVIRSEDGRVFTLSRAEVQEVAAGRVALGIPPGVTTGTVIIVAGGQEHAIPFHIAQAMTTPYTTYTMDASCCAIAGTWTGNISESDPGAVATAVIQVAADCRTISGFIHWEGPRIGSVDSTIDGIWDPASLTLVARDTQLFNVQPNPGGGFCPTERYQLTLSPDGRSLTGLNISNAAACRGQSSVFLTR
jgi:hypothetical protein